MTIKQVIQDGGRPIKIWTGDIEDEALTQLKNLSRLPFIHSNGLAVMPDVHAGKGSTVGSVIATTKAIIPAAVGVDIGCGMVAVRTSLTVDDLPDDLGQVRSAIEANVPVGFEVHKRNYRIAEDAWFDSGLCEDYEDLLSESYTTIEPKNAALQLGTLGGGNHFIELCLDESNNVWIMLHSGSRGIGNRIGSQFIELAKADMEKYFISLPDKDLAYLPEGSEHYDHYVTMVQWAQRYAFENRKLMLSLVLNSIKPFFKPFVLKDEAINCHHNYIERENHFDRNLWITRKGAIKATKGTLGIIPGSMGQRSFIVRGLGNSESYCSCSHGAGRRMSRTEARKTFSLDDLALQTAGVECRKDLDVIDEIPGAYKNIDDVMANQADLVEVVHTLKQVLCIKG